MGVTYVCLTFRKIAKGHEETREEAPKTVV